MDMKLKKLLGASWIVLLSLFATTTSYGQFDDFFNTDELDLSQYLKTGAEDASRLMGSYLNPVFTGFGYGAAGGWYNTAKTHKPLGFDLTFTLNFARAPEASYKYRFENADYTNVELTNNAISSQIMPTIFGEPDVVRPDSLSAILPWFDIEGNPTTVRTNFLAPSGLDYGSYEQARGLVPMPMIQLGVGLIKNTDLKVRYMPAMTSVENDGFEASMFGLGLMHDFKQWIPGIKHVPIDMAVLVAFNRINGKINLKSERDGAIQPVNPTDEQMAEMNINGLTYQVLVSKKLAILTLYGGIGYSQVLTTLEVRGSYEILDDENPAGIRPAVLYDPVDEKFAGGGLRGTGGCRIQLGFITLHADYTLQEYHTLTAGLGFTIR